VTPEKFTQPAPESQANPAKVPVLSFVTPLWVVSKLIQPVLALHA
jgi:hypothetical protein